MPKAIYKMWTDLEESIGMEATQRIKDFYESIRYTGSIDLWDQHSWRDAIKTLAFYERTGKILVRKDESIVEGYKAFNNLD